MVFVKSKLFKKARGAGEREMRGTMEIRKVLGTRDVGDEATKGDYGERWGEGHEGNTMYLIDIQCTL